ncbi:adenylyltransferase/cytidyltransferase family protein [bacterium]|nr:adenylyltransferase/cytidyltransferase family protein [bacterium]
MALQNIKTYFESANTNDFNELLDQPLVVSEKVQASSFHVKRLKDGQFEFYKSGQKTPMNKVDRTIVKYYENAINYFKAIDPAVIEQLPMDWKFGFDYLPTKKAVTLEYDMLPKNNLILTHVQVISALDPTQVKKVIRDPKIIYHWADILDVQRPQIIHQGKLSGDQKTKLLTILELSKENFIEKYKDSSFTREVYNIFNTGLNKTALHNTLENDVDSFILNFYQGKGVKSFKLERFDRDSVQDRTPSDMYQISILDLVEFMGQYDLSKVELKTDKSDERYLEIISIMFNAYVEKNATKYIGATFNSADFASQPGFELNKTFIQNEKTISLVQNKVLAELFKIALGSFRKKRVKETDIINKDLMAQLNTIVENIENLIMGEVKEEDVMNFTTYLKNQNLKTQTSPILEALKVDYPEQGKKLVNMFVGRFQPFTLGHAKVVETIHKQNGHPVVILLVKAKNKKKEDAFKRPYDEETQVAMINSLKSKYPIEEVFVIPTGGIDTMFNAMRPKYEPVLWGTGSDRMKTYGFQVNKDTYREDLGVRPDFGLYEIPRTGKNISATQVRNAMLDGDEKLFKKLTPKPIHNMYGELKTKLEDSMGVVAESTSTEFKTFNDFIKNI